jgi:hypothetical protein
MKAECRNYVFYGEHSLAPLLLGLGGYEQHSISGQQYCWAADNSRWYPVAISEARPSSGIQLSKNLVPIDAWYQ